MFMNICLCSSAGPNLDVSLCGNCGLKLGIRLEWRCWSGSTLEFLFIWSCHAQLAAGRLWRGLLSVKGQRKPNLCMLRWLFWTWFKDWKQDLFFMVQAKSFFLFILWNFNHIGVESWAAFCVLFTPTFIIRPRLNPFFVNFSSNSLRLKIIFINMASQQTSF